MRVLFLITARFPLCFLHCCGWWMGWLIFLLSPSYRRHFLLQVRQAQVGWRQWLPAVGHSGKLVAELPRIWLGKPVPARWANPEVVQQTLQQGLGAVLLTPHCGSFEATAQLYARDFGVVGNPLTVLFRPSRQAVLTDIVSQSRQRPGMRTAPTSLAGVKQLIKALRAGESVGILPDQVPPQGQGVWAPLFGRDAYTMTLAARMAAQTGAPMLWLWGERLPWGRGFVVHAIPGPNLAGLDVQEACGVLNASMEPVVRQAASQYLWGYNRYKQPRDQA
ncbi:lysophospholipid acyltransferase family protein [Curvibacter sp. CHRR-16]|uniref:lysophospholipid acyltransferase family protein n=1 Tax=Curvibacter sp. CHRR-16 TaxID=2835872 RepID=UPI001BD9A43E|nr:lysophospholipid acyltransferase family protein [Curvibacter sp. CHRR-16]MBT0569465.1 lysophospholipid acyltransferase family protein [Curvibacter sp. CHRR-16]